MKKFKGLSIVLVLLLMLAIMPSASATSTNPPIFDAIGLNIVLDEGKDITRFDLAKIAINLGGLEVVKTGKAAFVDVPEKHWAFPVVNTVYSSGYMGGLSDGTFSADSTATIVDAAQVLMSLLGYSQFAKQANWTSGNYLLEARSIGLLNGIDTSSGKLTPDILRNMIVNMLAANIVTITSVGTDGVNFDVDEKTTYLTNRYGYYFKEGTLQAVGQSAIAGSTSAGAGKVKVNGVIYNANGKDYSSYLGNKVRIIIDKDKSHANVIFMELDSNVEREELYLSANEITDFNNSSFVLSYVDEVGNPEEAVISRSSQMILNGQITEFNPIFMEPLSGGLKLVDNDNNGEYDYVYVTYELFYEVTGAFEGEYISDAIMGTPLNLEGVEFTVYNKGNIAGINYIQNESVISVTPGAITVDPLTGIPTPNNTLVKKASAEIDVKVVSGIVTSKSINSCVIGGIEYEYSKYYKVLADNDKAIKPALNQRVICYLNSDNCIVYTKLDVDAIIANQTFKYGYALKVMEKSSASNVLYIKVFSQDAEMQILETAEDYKFNGRKITSKNDVLSNTTLFPRGNLKEQLITYELNEEGKVSALSVAIVPDGFYDILNFSKDVTLTNQRQRNGFKHLYSFNNATLLFEIPADKSIEKNYKVKASSAPFANDVNYNVTLYDLNEKFEAGVALVDYSAGGSSARDLKFNHFHNIREFVVESTLRILNDDGEECTEITGLTYNGTEMEVKKLISVDEDLTDSETSTIYRRLYFNDFEYPHKVQVVDGIESLVNVAGSPNDYATVKWKDLKCGDVIHFETDAYGKVDRFRLLFREELMIDSGDNDDDGITNEVAFVKNLTSEGHKWHTSHILTGVIDTVFADGNFLFRSDPEVRSENTLYKAYTSGAGALLNVKVFIVENGKVRQGKISELRVGEPGFFVCESGQLYSVVLYRDLNFGS